VGVMGLKYHSASINPRLAVHLTKLTWLISRPLQYVVIHSTH